MKATIQVINPNRGMYAAKIDGQSNYVIFELLNSAEPEIGDIVSHPDFYSMGRETFNNITAHCEIEVYVQNVCSANLVRQQCML